MVLPQKDGWKNPLKCNEEKKQRIRMYHRSECEPGWSHEKHQRPPLYSVPSPSSGVFLGYWAAELILLCGSRAWSSFLGPKPVFLCSKWVPRQECCSPLQVSLVDQQTAEQPFRTSGLYSLHAKGHYRTLMFAITYHEKSQVFFVLLQALF